MNAHGQLPPVPNLPWVLSPCGGTAHAASDRRMRILLCSLAAIPLLLLVLLAGGASARNEQNCHPTVYAPKGSVHLKVKKAFRAHTPWVRTLAFHPCRNILVSGGNDSAMRYWDLSSEDPTANVKTWYNRQGTC